MFENKKQNLDKNGSLEAKKPENIKEFFKTLIIAIFFAVTIRSCFYEPFHIPSGSMKPSLLVGDYIFVSKMSYGYSKYSFPFSAFNLFEGRIFSSDPKRGDAAVFRLPSDTKINYIKRIVGLPGDEIKVENGVLFVNEKATPKIYKEDFIDQNLKIPSYEENFDGRKYLVLDQYQDMPQDFTPIYKVPKDHYFVMGDNRDNSQDSRFQSQVGFIPKNNLVGRATIIFFSSEYPVWKFWKWHKSIRFNRIFKKII
jgi:signal peptidase I